jgi:vitamin B12 transporter
MHTTGTVRRLCTVALLTGPAAATTELPPIFITAGRVAESPEQTLYATDVVDRAAIETSQARDAAEILQTITGVQLGRNGGAGQATSAFIRGAASDHTLVLVDGVPVNSGTVGSPALQHLSPDQIERIELVRGPASTLYGSSAIGGVVQVFTRRAGPGTSAQLSAGAGSQDSDSHAVHLGHRDGDHHASVSLSRRTTRGYPTRPKLSTLDRGYRNESFSGSLGTSLGGLTIELNHLQADGFVEYVDFLGSAVDQDTENSLTRLTIDSSPHARWDSRLLLGHARDVARENQSADFASTRRDYIDWQNTIRPDATHTLVAGITATWTDSALRSFGTAYDEGIRSLELYLQDSIAFGDSRLQLGARAIDNQAYGTHATWNLAFGHPLSASTRLHANLGTAFRAPSANDLYGFGGNPDFDPETSLSGEVGVRHRLSATDTLRVAAFQTEIDKLIETNIISYVTEQAEKARIRGVEVGYRRDAAPWSWSLDYTYMDPRNLDVDQLLARRARNALGATLRYAPGPWWIETDLRYQSERRDSRFSATIMDAYSTLDVAAGYRFSPSFSVSGRVQNLFDEDYELAASYPAQGRFISMELRYDYDAR